MRTKLTVIIAVLAVGAGLAHTALAATRSVAVGDYFFKAKSVTIDSGDKVRWSWKGEDDHNVVFTKKPRAAKKPKRCGTRSSGTCARTLRKKGTYRYVCKLHPDDMKGKIRVE